MITLILKTKTTRYAILKTINEERARAVLALCELRLGNQFPGAEVQISHRVQDFIDVEMHPDKEAIFARMREEEFAFPNEMVIDHV